MRIVIIGAGVIGSSLAWRLAERGQQVTLVDRAAPGTGATGSTFAWMNSNQKTPEDYYALNLAGMRLHRQLRDELGSTPWLHETGNVFWFTEDDDVAELEGRVARLQSWGYHAEWIDRRTLAEMEPDLTPEAEVEHMAYFPDEAWVDGPALVHRLTTLAIEHGAVLRRAHEVTTFERTGERITGVRLADGSIINADLVVNCAGPSAAHVAELAGRVLPMEARPGLVLRVSNVEGLLRRVVHAPLLHMRPDAGGLVMLHHGDADESLIRGEAPFEWIETFFERARAYSPRFANARLSGWSIGVRPIPEDNRTSAGTVKTIPGYAEIVTHSGITLGPLLGTLVARQIVDGTTDSLLEPFSPDRFTSG